MKWIDEEHRSWRWVNRFAFFPTRTLDAGWIWLRGYHEWQCSWGWGFFDRWPYLERTKEENGDG